MELYRSHVLVCGGTGCSSSGSAKLMERFEEQLDQQKEEIEDAYRFFAPIDILLIWLRTEVRQRLEQYAKGLFIAFNHQSDPEKAGVLLEELRELHRGEPGNAEVTGVLASGLFNAFYNQNDPEKAGELLEELQELLR